MTRTEHATHTLTAFPVYSLVFVSPTKVVLGGGGGATRSGIKNKLRLYEIERPKLELRQLDELQLSAGEDAPMTMAASITDGRIVCGINSAEDRLVAGQNENCRLFSVKGDKIATERVQQTMRTKNPEAYQRTASLSPDRRLLAAGSSAGSLEDEVALLKFPSLEPACEALSISEGSLYDTSISSEHLLVTFSSYLSVYSLPGTQDGPNTPLALVKKVDRPPVAGHPAQEYTFRSARFSPTEADTLYTVHNPASSPRSRSQRSKNAYICKWDTKTWTIKRHRIVDKKPITVFDVSEDGKLLAWGSSDLKVGVLDAKSLAPILTILRAHEFPPTALKFNPEATLLVSGSPDNSVRIIAVPDRVASAFLTWTLIVIAFLAILLALSAQRYS